MSPHRLLAQGPTHLAALTAALTPALTPARPSHAPLAIPARTPSRMPRPDEPAAAGRPCQAPVPMPSCPVLGAPAVHGPGQGACPVSAPGGRMPPAAFPASRMFSSPKTFQAMNAVDHAADAASSHASRFDLQRRCSGVLLHLTSLPGPHGIGDFGPAAFHVVDWLAGAGQTVWQWLPTNPIGPGDSPYQSVSAFAGSPLMVALEPLLAKGWLDGVSLPEGGWNPRRVDFSRIQAWRLAHLRRAHQGFLAQAMPAEALGAGPLEELEVVGVEHHAARIRVFPIHADCVLKHLRGHADGAGVAAPARRSDCTS